MSMLAERKRKNKWILLPKRAPDKPIWTTESEGLKFGQKLMEKMGWSAGKGLGANEQGIQEPLRVSYKNDTKGMGYKLNDGEWIEQQEEFNELLNQLSVTTDSKPKETSENSDAQIKSLEEKSKKSKSRVHYQKFTRGKDLSRYSENDLACILGTSKPKNTAKVEPEKSSNGEKEETFGVKTIHGGSLVDYFSNKWAEMKKGGKKVIDERNSNYGMNLSEPDSGDTPPVELDSKKKKAKKRKHSIPEENIDINNEFLNLNNQLEEADNKNAEEIKILKKNNFDRKKAKKSKTSLTDCHSESGEIQNKLKHLLEPDSDKIDEVDSIPETNSINEVSLNKKKKKRKKEKIIDENESETVENQGKKSSFDSLKSEEVEVESIEGKKIKKERKKKKDVEEFTQELGMDEVEKIEEDKENKDTGRKERKKKKKSEENVEKVDELQPDLQDASGCEGSGMETINSLPQNENEDIQNSKKDKKKKKQKRNKVESSMTPNDFTKLNQNVQDDSEITETNQNYEKPKKKKERKHEERINNDKDKVERLEEEINLNEGNPEKGEEEGGESKTKKKKKKKMKNEEDNPSEELKNSTETPEKKSKKKKKEKIEEVKIESRKDSNAIEECRLKEKKTKKHKINEDESVDTSTIEPECKNGGQKSKSEESFRQSKDQNKSFLIQNETDNSTDVIYTHKAIGLNKKKYPASTQNMSNDKALKMYCGAEVNQFNGSNLADLEGYGNSLKKTNPVPTR